MKKTESLSALADRHRSPSANEIYSSARVYLQSSKTDSALSPVEGTDSPNTSPDKSEFAGGNRVAFSKDDGKQELLASAKHVKELRPPNRLRSKSAISENELPSNEGLGALNPVKLERAKTNSVTSDAGDISGAPPLSFSPHELVVPLGHAAGRSPGPREMAGIRKKLFTSASQDASGAGGALGSSTAPAAMLRSNIPPRHNGGQASAPSSLSLTAPEGLSIITSSTGIVLDGVAANEVRTKSEGGRDRGAARGDGRASQEKKSLNGVRRPPLSKEKIIKKSNRDNDSSLLDLSVEDISASPPSVRTRPRRGSKPSRTVEPIEKRPVLDKKALTRPDPVDFTEVALPPSKQQQLVPVRPPPEALAHGPAPPGSASSERSSEGVPSPSPKEEPIDAFPVRASPGDGKGKVPALGAEAAQSDRAVDSRESGKENNKKSLTKAPVVDCTLSYSESESGGALSSSLGAQSAAESPHQSASENDNILLRRIQEAQALNRKEEDNGAVMHKFSLWSNADPTKFRPLPISSANDETVAPDKKPSKLRGPRAALQSDGDAIPGHGDSPKLEDGDTLRASSSTMVSKVSGSSTISGRTVFKAAAVLPIDCSEQDDCALHVEAAPVGAALGASGAMAMALRSMVGSAKMPSSPSIHDADGEEFSYLNTCGSVDSLDDEGDVDFMSSIDETEMLSRATSVEVDEQDYQLHDSEDEDNMGRRGAKHYETPPRVSAALGVGSGSAGNVSSAEAVLHSTPPRGAGGAAAEQSGAEREMVGSVDSSAGTERKLRTGDADTTYITPPREKRAARQDGGSSNAFVHHSHPQPASARRLSADSTSSKKGGVAMSLDQMKVSECARARAVGTDRDSPGLAAAADSAMESENHSGDIAHNLSDDRSVDFTLREKRRHHQHRMTGAHDSESRVGSTSSGVRPGRAAGSKQPIPWVRGEPIGQGTFGRVYRGMNEGTGELLAVKQITLVDGADDEVHSLRGEIRLMKSLNHANIVRYLGTSVSERYLFIIMEYVPGGSIAGMLSQFGAFSEPLISRFIRQILCGVAYLHGKGIIHRDIKGANVLVTDAGVAKLADFGCSKQLVGLTTASLEDNLRTISGSVPWMAPEVIKQTGHGLSADIWSVGATVIEMITAKHPWQEFTNSLAALFHVATSNSPPAFPPKISGHLNSFLGRCLVIKPEERATAAELQQHPFVAEKTDRRES